MRVCAFAALGFLLATQTFGQMSTEEAYRRMEERKRGQTAAATSPTTEPTTQPAQPNDPVAIAAIQRLSKDLNDIMEADPGVSHAMGGAGTRDYSSAIDAAFGLLKGQSFQFTGAVFGVTSSVPKGDGRRAVLVRLALPPSEEASAKWRQEYTEMRRSYDEREKAVYHDHDFEQKVRIEPRTLTPTGRAIREKDRMRENESVRKRVKVISDERDPESKRVKERQPPSILVELYLVAPEEFLSTVKKERPIRGRGRFIDGAAETAVWRGAKGSVTYAGTIKLVAEFDPD